MPTTKTDKRSRLIQTAVKLAYRHGFRTTSLADIAEAAKVPVGNVYYYFKTKDEIGEAIVEQRLLELRTLQEQWDQRGSPKERLLACIENTFENRDLLARGGCPVGTLCSELHKEGGPLAKKATALFTELLGWIEDQFRAIGRGDTSRKLATQLLSSLQGVSVRRQRCRRWRSARRVKPRRSRARLDSAASTAPRCRTGMQTRLCRWSPTRAKFSHSYSVKALQRKSAWP